MSKRDSDELVRRALDRGWRWERRTGTGHVMMRWPGGGKVTFSATPSGAKRGMRNAEAIMRRIERTNPVAQH